MPNAKRTNDKRSDNGNGRKPEYVAYVIQRGRSDEKGYWREVGAAWNHEDGEGVNVKLFAIPPDGELVLRTRRDGEQPSS